MDPEFLWGTVVPSYAGALGTIAASTIAAIALFRDVSTRKGLREVAQASTTTVTDSAPASIAYPARESAGESQLEMTTLGNQTVLRNMTDLPIVIQNLDVPNGGKVISLRENLPATVAPGEGFGFIVHTVLSGPAIAALMVQWTDGEGAPKTSRFFV